MEKYRLILSKTSYVFMLLVAASIPLSIAINNLLLIGLFLSSLTCFLLESDKKILINRQYIILIVLYFLCSAAFFTSSNLKPVFFDLEQKLPLLVLPIVFMISPALDQKKRLSIITVFVVTTFIVCLLNFRTGLYWGYGTDVEYEMNPFVRRPYLGMYCVFCIFFGLELLMIERKALFKMGIIFLLCFYNFFLVVLFAKWALVVYSILLLIYTLWQLLEYRKYKWLFFVSITFLTAITYGTIFNSKGATITKKLMSFSEFDWSSYDANIVNSVNLRFAKWTCSAKVLNEDKNWLFGAGTGDAQDLLNKCYEDRYGKDSFFVVEHFNSHNQYFTTWLNLGLVPLLVLIIHFIYALYGYLNSKSWLPAIFTIGIILFCITESIFETQKGIVFYSFFSSLLAFKGVKSVTFRDATK